MKVGEIVTVTTTTFAAQSYELNAAPPFGSLLRVQAGPDTTNGAREPRGSRGRPAAYYALCYATETGSIEPGRHAVAWGRFEDDEDDVYRRQPQLNQVLRTTFDALIVGYDDDTSLPDAESPPYPALDGHVSNGYAAEGHGANGYAAEGYTANGNGVAVRADGHVATRDGERAPIQRVPPTPPRLHALVYAATPAQVVRFNGNLAYLRFVLRANLPNADDVVAATIDHAYRAMGHDRAFLVGAARAVARLLGAEHERVMNVLELLDGC